MLEGSFDRFWKAYVSDSGRRPPKLQIVGCEPPSHFCNVDGQLTTTVIGDVLAVFGGLALTRNRCPSFVTENIWKALSVPTGKSVSGGPTETLSVVAIETAVMAPSASR